MDVTYQRAFIASKSFLAVLTGHYELSPSRERYYDMQADHIVEKNVGMDKYKIHKAISRVKLEDEAEYERNIEYVTQEDDDYNSPWKEDALGLKAVTDSSDSGKITFKQPTARKEPITDTKTLYEPIKGSHLGERFCH